MRAYLVRHARPVDAIIDPTRPLSAEGLREIELVAAHLASSGDVAPEVIIHSGRARARQTAEELTRRLAPPRGLKEEEGLGPDDDVCGWSDRLASSAETMLVGHMPFMGYLSREMTGGGVCGWNTEFRTAEVACFELSGEGCWTLLWHIAPADIG